MKRVFAILLTVVMILSLIPFTAFAENENILKEANSTFESGKTSWMAYGEGNVEVVDNPEGEWGYIRLYDEVVTKGVEMYDNKLV